MLPNLAVVPEFTPTAICRLRGPGPGQGRSNLAGTSLLLKRNCIQMVSTKRNSSNIISAPSLPQPWEVGAWLCEPLWKKTDTGQGG